LNVPATEGSSAILLCPADDTRPAKS